MSVLNFAIASLVDAHTGLGTTANTRKDYLNRYIAPVDIDQKTRANSLVTLTAGAKDGFRKSFEAFREWSLERRARQNLMNLDDHMLKDIGVDRGDLALLKNGTITMTELRHGRNLTDIKQIATRVKVTEQIQGIEPVNEELFNQDKCA
jgi:uncharacterized protein YjiS (DUF1127 family)